MVAAIWIVQLIWSPLWLKAFGFGPAEGADARSLTYWRRQPMRRESLKISTELTENTG